MKKVIAYCIEEEIIGKINKQAKEKRVSASWFVNEILFDYLNKKGGKKNEMV